MGKIIIFDTTLRDGEQAPGAAMTSEQKLEVAFALEKMGVDIIEAGFPIASPDDFNAVSIISQRVKNSAICALARCMEKDIDAAVRAVKQARMPRVHVFLATSKIHMQYKFRKAEDEILELAVKSVRMARKGCADIEFSPEDATRTERDFIYRVIEGAIRAGASTINVPDTVGYSYPQEIFELITDILDHVPNINKAVLSIHCHDDLGMSTANSLSGILAGCRQAHCTINGIGERAGNASLEEIVMALKVRKDVFKDMYTSIVTEHLSALSRMVSNFTGFVVPPNKAIVGKNALRHESGIHQDAVLKKKITYEIFDAKAVGYTEDDQLVLGKHSGRHALVNRLKVLGFTLDDAKLEEVFVSFKQLADKKKEVFDEDLIALAGEHISVGSKLYELVSVKVTTGTGLVPEAEVCILSKKKTACAKSIGDGPVDACYKAVDKITGRKGQLLEYRLDSVTKGKDALGEATIKVKFKDRLVVSRGSSTDIIEASVRAYLNALNKIESL